LLFAAGIPCKKNISISMRNLADLVRFFLITKVAKIPFLFVVYNIYLTHLNLFKILQ